MSLSLTDARSADPVAGVMSVSPPNAVYATGTHRPRAIADSAWHSLLWLVFANAVGVLLGLLLLVPSLNSVLGEWTYGRWMPVHMNLELYGWASLPLVGFLFKVYGADQGAVATWCRPALWAWSTALGIGALTWLNGRSSGKLFLDWTGYSRSLFPLAIVAVWLVLAYSLRSQWRASQNSKFITKVAKVTGLVLLLAVPILIYVAASPTLYPPINPDTGGPTGASQLESTLVVVAILLLLPFGLTRRKIRSSWRTVTAWSIFAVEAILCLGLGRADVSHHQPIQYISLASLLVWIPLTPAYYSEFDWHPNTRRWRIAFLFWWSILVPTGWCLFLPGVLDHFKFTDGLVAHSLLAMAGFTTSLLIFVMVQILGDDGWIFNGIWSFYAWQGSVLAYVLLMTYSGWLEGFNASFTIVPGIVRNWIYIGRLTIGVLMLIASTDWLVEASKLLRTSPAQQIIAPQEPSL